MTRTRLALALGVLAVFAVAATAVVAVATYGGDGSDEPAEGAPEPSRTRVVTDSASTASFEVPVDGWEVRDARTRIYYDDGSGQAIAVVRGPAVFRAGYCDERPRGSNRAFAGFTRQPFQAWVDGLGAADSSTEEAVTLADGSDAQLRMARVHPAAAGPCASEEVYVAMVRADGVRVVLVADTGASGTLAADEVGRILRSVSLGGD